MKYARRFRPRRLRRRRAVRPTVKKAVRKVVKREILRHQETKYISTQLCLNQSIDPAIHSPSQDCFPLVPKILQGTNEAQRIGVKVTPTKCRVDISVSFKQPNPGQVDVPAFTAYAQHIYVVIYLLKSKPYDNWLMFQQSTQYMGLLDNGDGTASPFGTLITPSTGSPFWTANTSDLMKPIELSEYTLLRRKVVKLTKNVGNIDTGVAGNSQVPNLQTSSWFGSFNYTLPTLSYDDTSSVATLYGGYPTNTNVLMALGWCYADNNGTYYLDANSTQIAPDQVVTVTARSHVWYKDS